MNWMKSNTIPCIISLIMLMSFNQGYGKESVMNHLSYRSDINHRYAVTWVTAHMENPSENATEILFKITLPKTAFISGLIMEVDGLNYTSRVEEKKAAQKIYDTAKKQGVHAGLVKQSGTTEQKFEVSTNVEAMGKVIFYLKYEELLLRSKGKYTQNIQIKSGVNPSELDITVNIKESAEILGLKVLNSPLGPYAKDNGSSSNGTHVQEVNPNHAVVSYHSHEKEGLYGELTLTYDVKRRKDAGEIQVMDGYFVHFFSPEGLEKMAAHTVFILDVSGSMQGDRLNKLKESMLKIFNDLQPEDSFELLTFSNNVDSLGIYAKNNSNDMKLAKEKISNLGAWGSTNINDALIHGFKNALKSCQISANQVVFLTDGQATTGVTELSSILYNVQEINTDRIPLYSLAFGNDTDFRFLNKISFHNRGFARKIPVDSNTEEILRGFYQEIGTPLMADIDIKYSEDAVNQTTIVKNGWSTLQKGNEIIVAGQMKQGKNEVHPKIDGIINTGSHQFKVPRISKPIQLSGKENFIGHLWAYLTIKNLLNTADLTDYTIEKEELNARALSLALKYNFVTKLTSLVVVRPGDLLEEENIPLLSEEDPPEATGWIAWAPTTTYRTTTSITSITIAAECDGCINGQCVSSYTCSCLSGWTGYRCHEPVCDSECMNGKCISPNTCSCPSGWTGQLCDIRICDPSCVMGERVSPNNCSCSSGWIGQHCDRRCPSDSFTSFGKCYKLFTGKKLRWQDAKSKCSSVGLKAASKPSDPVGLRKYIIDNYDIGTLVWLDAQGTGSQYIWTQDNSTLSFEDPLWANGEPYRGGNESCLYLRTWKIDWEQEPESPYGSGRCMDNTWAFALCEM